MLAPFVDLILDSGAALPGVHHVMVPVPDEQNDQPMFFVIIKP